MSRWRKSSFSNGNGGNNCVETFTTALSGQVFVRNSKLPRVAVTFTKAEWAAFLAGVKAGEFDGDGGA
jgi:hypothetical protein